MRGAAPLTRPVSRRKAPRYGATDLRTRSAAESVALGAALPGREPEQFHGWRAADPWEDVADMDLRGAGGEGLGETSPGQ